MALVPLRAEPDVGPHAKRVVERNQVRLSHLMSILATKLVLKTNLNDLVYFSGVLHAGVLTWKCVFNYFSPLF